MVARDGTAIASWMQPQTDVSSGYDITTAVRPPGGAFAAPVVQTNNTSSFQLLDMAIDRNGNTLLLVARLDSATQTSVHFISRLAGGNFSGTIQVWTRTSDFSTTGVAVTGGRYRLRRPGRRAGDLDRQPGRLQRGRVRG